MTQCFSKTKLILKIKQKKIKFLYKKCCTVHFFLNQSEGFPSPKTSLQTSSSGVHSTALQNMDLFYSFLSFEPFCISWIRIHGHYLIKIQNTERTYTVQNFKSAASALYSSSKYYFIFLFLFIWGHFGLPGSGFTSRT